MMQKPKDRAESSVMFCCVIVGRRIRKFLTTNFDIGQISEL